MHFRSFYLLIFLCVNTLGYSYNYAKVDSLVGLYSKKIQKIDDLVQKINSDFTTQQDKSRAIFYWISSNIVYDVEFSDKIDAENIQAFSYKTNAEFIQKEKKFNLNLALSTFMTRKAVCYGYSALYGELASRLGIECKLIRGNLKCEPNQIGAKLETNHGWNVVKINDQWKFVDCTLAAGHISSKTQQFVFDYNDIYFFTEPELFFLNHFPDDVKWLLLKNKTKADYVNLPLYFVSYLNDTSIVSLPKNGMFSKYTNFEIKFDNFNYGDNSIDYIFSEQSQRTYVDLYEKPVNLIIPLTDKANQILYIFLNGKLFAAYKIS